MTMAVSLQAAAGLAFDNLQVKWLAGQLKFAVTSFCAGVKPVFSEQNAASHPAINWNTILWALGQQTPSGVPPITTLTLSAQYVFRMCWMVNQLSVQTLITSGQAASVLSLYNQFLAVP